MAPTLVTACTALPTEGPLLAWDGPALRRMATALVSPSSVVERADGALSFAAVLRGGLGPLPPPLCRCAECTIDPLSPAWRAFHRHCRLSSTAASRPCSPVAFHPVRSPGAWCGRRSGIKEEAAALSRNGGQPRSRPHQVPGRAQYKARVGSPALERKQNRDKTQARQCPEFRNTR
jgi:hypothetical protein